MICLERILTSKGAQALLDVLIGPELDSRAKTVQSEKPQSVQLRVRGNRKEHIQRFDSRPGRTSDHPFINGVLGIEACNKPIERTMNCKPDCVGMMKTIGKLLAICWFAVFTLFCIWASFCG